MGSAILTLNLRRSPSSSSSSKTSTVVQSCCDPGHHLHSSLQFSQRGLEFTMRLLCVAVLLITFTIQVHAKKRSAHCSFKWGDCAWRAKTACNVLNGVGMCHDEVCNGRDVADKAFVRRPSMCKCCFPESPCDGDATTPAPTPAPTSWRADYKCGGSHIAPNGNIAQCNPSGNDPCCSAGGWCGNTDAHCYCDGCTDYRGYSEGCPEGFFKTSGSNRCYKFHGDMRRTWAEADQLCKSLNSVLAMTDDNAVELTSYILDTYEPSTTNWLGAKSDGSVFRWEHTNDIVPESSLWLSYYAASGKCLMMLTHSYYVDNSPDAPFFSYDCTATRYALCEKL